MNAKSVIRWFRRKLFPTERERTVARWLADGGDAHLRLDYDLGPESLVLDVGGYRGQWSSDLYARYLCRIVIFEPVAAFAEGIRQRFARNPSIQVRGFGLGGASRREAIAVSADASSVCGAASAVSGAASAVSGAASSVYVRAYRREEAEIVDIAQWIRDEGIASIQLIKVNIEGGEYELLERLMDTGPIRMVDNLQVQFHDIGADSAARMAAIQQRLSETHEPVYQYPWVWEGWRRRED